ncbi:hypothetical protein QBC38DRAFT_481898 [Podospora fimiseda]|uniref:LysM domain-containing protein n=1 Tax=Podospora fimiseda TaxID=252190 RepID=A0AAN7GVN5_9PEZI|nr:hypothetical protein QBC38DRAFT_481898 [Podospora fimiseda]
MKLSTLLTALSGLLATVSAQYMPNIVPHCNKYHLVAWGQTCDSITSLNGISLSQFLSWNPAVDSACINLWLGYYVCVGVSGTTFLSSTITVVPPTSTTGPGWNATSTVIDPPPPTANPMPGVIASCKKYHLVVSGDTCAYIAGANGITLAQFNSWNTFVDSSCSNLWLGYTICVGV